MNTIQKIYRRIVNRYYRLRLRNDDFTIIASTCIAGVMYNMLGKQFKSPTINIWMTDEDLLKMVANLKHYLAQPLRFVLGIDTVPTAYCDDVLIHFQHYKTGEEAATKRYDRRERVNYDNLFIVCADRPSTDDGEITHEQMLSLKKVPCRGKVVFSVRQHDDIDYIVPLPRDAKGEYVNLYMFDKEKKSQRWRWETAFDWVHWLNTGEVKVMS